MAKKKRRRVTIDKAFEGLNPPKSLRGNKVFENREGFWRDGEDSLLPMPVAREKPWKGKGDFLKALEEAESDARASHCKGSSTCRVCGLTNGSVTFSLAEWVWPCGLCHYVKVHNVRPSLAFQEFILGATLR